MADPIVPVYKQIDSRTGRWTFGLRPADLAKVEAGFACLNCLEPFEIGGIPIKLDKCYVCGEVQLPDHPLFGIQPVPEGW